jgi:threonine dehydrogenase-like Zn-dependent dehydrogenase
MVQISSIIHHCGCCCCCRRAQVQPGKKVAILGAGPIGLITAIVAAAFGADAIAITDISHTKLTFASQHCPRVQPLLISPADTPADVAATLTQCCFQGSAPEVVIDCAGFQQTLEAGLRVVAPGGRVVLVGMGQEYMRMPATLLTVKEVDLLGSFRWACGVQGRCSAACTF